MLSGKLLGRMPSFSAMVLRFAEHVSPEDIERRNKLWPTFKIARRNKGKAAYFVGGRGFINSSEIHIPP
jgi:hypothetical protein